MQKPFKAMGNVTVNAYCVVCEQTTICMYWVQDMFVSGEAWSIEMTKLSLEWSHFYFSEGLECCLKCYDPNIT